MSIECNIDYRAVHVSTLQILLKTLTQTATDLENSLERDYCCSLTCVCASAFLGCDAGHLDVPL